jgi:hypothetical protein
MTRAYEVPPGTAERLAKLSATARSLERLEHTIRTQRNMVVNGIANRRAHPSYGYTKAMIRAEFRQLQGLIAAWAVVTGAWPHAGHPLGVASGLMPDVMTAAAERLGIDLAELGREVEAS